MPQTLAIYGGGGGPRLTAGPGLLNRTAGTWPRLRVRLQPVRGGGVRVSPAVVRAAPASTMGGPPKVNAMKDKLGTKKKTQLSNYS